MSVIGTLYKLIFSNGKAYIGITVRRPQQRWWDHRQYAKTQTRPSAIYHAWKKHGEPKMVVLSEFHSVELLRAAERVAIAEHGTLAPRGYNMTLGGETNPMDVPEIARRVGDKNVGRVHTEEARRNMGLSRKGQSLSKEHRQNIGAGQIGRVHSNETREKIKNKALGRKRSPASMAKQSASCKGVPKGPMSAETKHKLSDVRRAYWERMRRDQPEELHRIITKSAEGIERSWARRRAA